MTRETHVVMGRIGAPWGVKGWVKVHSFAQPPENLLDYREFAVETPDGLSTVVFDELKSHGQGFVGHIKGCDVREQTGAWTGSELMLAKQDLPANWKVCVSSRCKVKCSEPCTI